MDKEKVKLIVRNLELLIDSLKAEIYLDEQPQKKEALNHLVLDYEEVFIEDDGYSD